MRGVTAEPPLTSPDGHTALVELARAQHGVVTREQLVGIGVSARAIDCRVAAGRLVRVHRGVYAVGLVPLSPDARALAAVLACGPGAVLGCRSAAILWGLAGGGQARWDVTAPARSGGRRGPDDVRLRRTRRLTADDVTTRRGIPVTTVARTLVDLAATDPLRIATAVHEAEVAELLDVRAVEAAIARHPGRAGTAALRAALGPAGPEPDRGRFVAAFLHLCSTHRLPAPEVSAWLEAGGVLHEIDLLTWERVTGEASTVAREVQAILAVRGAV
jgi:hypothetical protein